MTFVLSVDPSDPRPIYIQIVDEVRRAVVRGALGPGDPLPSVRELARRLRVNPNTVQQAYRELEQEGLVETRRGRGSFVSPGTRAGGEARDRVIQELAAGALREAARAGVTPEELLEAIRAAAQPGREARRTRIAPQKQQETPTP